MPGCASACASCCSAAKAATRRWRRRPRYFNLSPRTLIRRLKDEGSAYQQLLDAVRQERAGWYLAHTRLSVEEIAARLGYADTSNFSRTYRRWFGRTPSQARGGAA